MRKRPTIVNSFFIMLTILSSVNTIYTSEVDATTVEFQDFKSELREMASMIYQQDALTAEEEEKYVMQGNDCELVLYYLIYFSAQFHVMGDQIVEEYEKHWYNHLEELKKMKEGLERDDVDPARLKRLFYNSPDLLLIRKLILTEEPQEERLLVSQAKLEKILGDGSKKQDILAFMEKQIEYFKEEHPASKLDKVKKLLAEYRNLFPAADEEQFIEKVGSWRPSTTKGLLYVEDTINGLFQTVQNSETHLFTLGSAIEECITEFCITEDDKRFLVPLVIGFKKLQPKPKPGIFQKTWQKAKQLAIKIRERAIWKAGEDILSWVVLGVDLQRLFDVEERDENARREIVTRKARERAVESRTTEIKSVLQKVVEGTYQLDNCSDEDEKKYAINGDYRQVLRYFMYFNAQFHTMDDQIKEEYEKNWHNHLEELKKMREGFEKDDVDPALLKRLFFQSPDLLLIRKLIPVEELQEEERSLMSHHHLKEILNDISTKQNVLEFMETQVQYFEKETPAAKLFKVGELLSRYRSLFSVSEEQFAEQVEGWAPKTTDGSLWAEDVNNALFQMVQGDAQVMYPQAIENNEGLEGLFAPLNIGFMRVRVEEVVNVNR